mmetsp:Transcript_10445/g.23072  ORF Transcript_10445/g.23072 Transcript_10445/m.23072 type:complete len:166 (-) Transcript_10445:21-518(-)
MVELLVFTLPQSMFKIQIKKGGMVLSVATQLPAKFLEVNRNARANQNVAGYNDLTAERNSFDTLVTLIDSLYDKVVGDPQDIVLPFKVEDEIVSWKVSYETNSTRSEEEGQSLRRLLDRNQQFFAILKIELKSAFKPTAKHRAAINVVVDSDVSEDSDDDGMDGC